MENKLIITGRASTPRILGHVYVGVVDLDDADSCVYALLKSLEGLGVLNTSRKLRLFCASNDFVEAMMKSCK